MCVTGSECDQSFRYGVYMYLLSHADFESDGNSVGVYPEYDDYFADDGAGGAGYVYGPL